MKNNEKIDWLALEITLQDMISMHQKALLTLGRRIIPTLTPEDVLQPNDYQELDNHPEFRYEEGMLAGILSAQMALRALRNEQNSPD